MPQFTPWAITNPAPNVLFNPAAVDQSIADTQSKLGDLDIRRQQLGIEQQKLDLQRTAGAALLGGLGGDGTGAAPPADATPFEQQMGAAEGGSDPTAVNKQGYAGQFQFGSQRLADLGLYTPAPGEGKNEWKGQFHIAPYNVSTLQDFLGNPAAQHAAFVAHVANIDQAINNTPGADKFDRNGLRAVAHLGGVGGMQAFVQSGGSLNSADSNGTTLKQYYQKFTQGGPAALQQSFGSVHGPGGPPSNLPAVQPGGNVSTVWVDPNAPLPVPPIPPAGGPPPFNPNAGPRVAGAPPALPGAIVPPVTGSDPNAPVQIPPVGQARSGPIPPPPGGSADAAPIAPSPIALRTGGTDVAGPGAGPDTTLPAVPAPNQMYQTGMPGITIGGPSSNTLAPPPAAAQSPASAGVAPTAPAAAAGASTPPGVATRPPPLLPPPAPSRTIPLEPVLPSGLTAGQVRLAAAMVQSGAPIADVAAHIEQWKQANLSGRQQAATQAAVDANAQFERQKYYQQQLQQADQTAYERQRNAATDARSAETQRLAQEAAGREAEKARREASLAANPVQGIDVAAQHENTLLTVGPKIRNGTATPAEKDQYASAYYAAQQAGAQPVTITDPNNQGQTIPAIIPRRLPPAFPEPEGGALPPVVATPGAAKQEQMTDAQAGAAGYADRMRAAEPIMSALDTSAVTWGQGVRERAGNFVGYNLNSPDFQKLRTAQEAFLVGILRKESGAAISPSEWDRYGKMYFPAPGDDANTIRLKQQFRQTAIEGMTREAGPGYKPGGGMGTSGTPASTRSAAPNAPASVRSDADFHALPSGALFVGPDGQTRRKP